MSFLVSARKYRPVRFDEVVGQSHISQTLKNALINQQVAHAFLFCGPRGVGKTTCARILAKVLNCEKPGKDMEACDKCSSCLAFNENASFNIHELDAASNNSVDHIRALTDQVRFQPQQGKYKIYIIDEVHMLSQAAFNAFLKTLEEPPPYAIFILATTEKHKIIPTILSRCQIFDFRRISTEDMVSHLETICKTENIETERDALHVISQKADGALRDALSIFDRIVSFSNKKITYQDVITNLNILDYDYYFRVVDAMLVEDVSEVLLILNETISKGFDPDIFMTGLAEHLRNLLVCQDESTLSLLDVGESIAARYFSQAKIIDPSFLLTGMNLANDCDVEYRMARNKRLHVEMALIKMCYINRALKPENALPVEALAEKKTPVSSKVKKSTQKQEKKITDKVGQMEASPQNKEVAEENTDGSFGLKEEIQKVSEMNGGSLMLSSIDQLEAEVDADDAVLEELPQDLLNLENLEAAWKKYWKGLSSKSTKVYFKSSGLKLKDKEITVLVGSSVAEGAVKGESNLLQFLQEELCNREIILNVEIDLSRKVIQPKVQKPLSEREKYEKLSKRNPHLELLRKKFDLQPDGS